MNNERSFIFNIMEEKYNGKSMKSIFSDFRWNLKRKHLQCHYNHKSIKQFRKVYDIHKKIEYAKDKVIYTSIKEYIELESGL